MKSILLSVPDSMKAQLDQKRAEGYSLNGYIRTVLAQALTASPTRTGRVSIQYRKPGGRWQQRTIRARQLKAMVLKLENQGAEIVTREEPA
jgi:hypothetical protein